MSEQSDTPRTAVNRVNLGEVIATRLLKNGARQIVEWYVPEHICAGLERELSEVTRERERLQERIMKFQDCPEVKHFQLPCTRSDEYGEVVPAQFFWDLRDVAFAMETRAEAAERELEELRGKLEPEKLAQSFHAAYERLAPSFGYVTNEATRTWNPESANGRLMIAVCSEIRSAIDQALAIQRGEDQLDAQRLDYMIAHGCHMAGSRDGDYCWLMFAPDNEEEGYFRRQPGAFNSGREAIDAAIRALKG